MGEIPRFGAEFTIDGTNRMDVLRSQELPEYVDLSREARQRLKESLETEGWPETPANVENVEDLFEHSRGAVDQRWSGHVQELINQKCTEWLAQVPENEDTEDIRDILSDPAKLESAMQMRQFDVLEGLRVHAPEAWRSLVLLSSERQLASVTLMRHWRESLTDTDCEKLGMNKDELGIFLDTAGILGKYVDHAYVKQIELADAPGGSSPTALGEKSGASYLYDIYNSEKDAVDLKTYREVFPFEWEKLMTRFNGIAARVETLLSEKRLPPAYEGLPAYLRQMAETYGSTETTPEVLHQKWQTLLEHCRDLAQAGCPIMIIPQNCQGVAGDANKMDVELRLGLQTEKTKSLAKQFDAFRATAQQFVDENEAALQQRSEVPPVILNYQPFAFGPNLFLYTMAENSDRLVMAHTNAVADVATHDEMPFVKKMFGIDTKPEQYGNAALIASGTHELGHAVVLNTDAKVAKRVGSSNDAWILEEVKGEALGVKNILETAKRGAADIDLENQFTAELGTLCSYLDESREAGSMGERYYFAGAVIMHRLMASGVIVQSEQGYTINDAKKGLEVIAKLGDEILALYTNEATKPKDVNAYAREIKKAAAGQNVKRFVKKLKK